jgi:hypothetical protein
VRQFQQPEAAGQPQSQDDFALWRQQEMDSPGIDLQAPEIYTTPAYLNEDALARARNAVAGAYDAPEEGTR